jgi:hypothetical protein
MNPLFVIPEDFAALTEDELRSFIDGSRETAARVAESPSEFISEGRSASQLLDEMSAGVAAIEEARAELTRRETQGGGEGEGEGDLDRPRDGARAGARAAHADRGRRGRRRDGHGERSGSGRSPAPAIALAGSGAA